MSLRFLLLLAGASALGACGHPEDYRWSSVVYSQSPEVEKALDEATRATGKDFRRPQLSVYAYSRPAKRAPGAASWSLEDLSDHGQGAFIDAVARAGSRADSLRAALARPIAGPGAGSGSPRDLNRFDLTLSRPSRKARPRIPATG